MNDTNMIRFRESFRGYNKDDVNAYIEQVNLRCNRRESELRAQIAELQGTIVPVAPSPSNAEETEALREALAKAESEIARLKAEMENAPSEPAVHEDENAEKSRLYDSMSAQVGNILIVAKSNAEKILADAKTEAERIKADAAYDAERLHRTAEEKLASMTAVLEQKMKGVSDSCLAEYEALMREARIRFGEITEMMKDRAKGLLAEADRKSKDLEDLIAKEYSDTVSEG